MSALDPDTGTAPQPGGGARKRFATADLLAGVSVALILIPQSLAYAEIAGVPAYIGLFAAAVPPIAAALFASSPYLQTGPVAMTSLLTFGALATLEQPQTADYIKLAALLALLVGLIRIALGVGRGGVIAYFMSQPILLGFTAGAAILILASQLPTALGTTPPAGKLLARAWWALVHPGEWETASLVLGAVTIVVVLAGRRLHPLFPGVLVAVLAGLAYAAWSGYDGLVVGDIPSGLPPFSLDLPYGRIADLLLPAAVIAVVGFAEPAAISRTFAAQDRSRWDPNRELIGQGLANVASGLSGAFPVGGSFSRSSVNRLAGGKTRWSGAVTGAVVLAFLPFAGVVSSLPRAVLAAIVIAAVARLIRIDRVLAIFPRSRAQGTVAVVTFAGTLLLAPRIDQAVLIGIALGVAVHLRRELRTHVESQMEGDTLRLRAMGVFFFASAPALQETLIDQLAAHPEAQRVVLDLTGIGRVDYTGALAIRSLSDEAALAGVEFEVEGIGPHVRETITSLWRQTEYD